MLQESQKKCNFVIFASTKWPSGLALTEESLREETFYLRCSLRQVFEGSGRKMVVKQFLYDWAPPAYDYPSLWRDHKLAPDQKFPAPTAHMVGNNALWWGKNYRLENAATIEVDRTRIEFTFPNGEFSKKEIIELCEGLVPVDGEARKSLLAKSFGSLSFQSRQQELASDVPTSYWKHQRSKTHFCFPLANAPELPVSLNEALRKRGYLLNTLFAFGLDEKTILEREYLFEHQEFPGAFIRLLTPTSYPPLLGDQDCLAQDLYATSKQFHLGPHEFVFKKEGSPYLVLVKPAPWTTRNWANDLMEELIR